MWLFACAIALFAMAGRAGASEQDVFPQGKSKKEDAQLPAGVKLYWGEEPTEPLSAKREQICLNGIWEFVPMLNKADTEPPSGKAGNEAVLWIQVMATNDEMPSRRTT